LQGDYKHYNLPLNFAPVSLIKKFEPRISIHKLTIQFKLPNGNYYAFGENNNDNVNTVNKIILKVKQLKHSISTTFLHKENS